MSFHFKGDDHRPYSECERSFASHPSLVQSYIRRRRPTATLPRLLPARVCLPKSQEPRSGRASLPPHRTNACPRADHFPAQCRYRLHNYAKIFIFKYQKCFLSVSMRKQALPQVAALTIVWPVSLLILAKFGHFFAPNFLPPGRN